MTPDDDPAFLCQDAIVALVALDADRGINIGQPSLHARCLDAVALTKGAEVLQVGAGSGYYTALMAHLVGPGGRVRAYEIDPSLAARAERNLSHLPSVSLRAQSGIADILPKVDAVYVNAGITQPSMAWLDALRPGGRLLFPLQPVGAFGGMLLVRRPRHGLVGALRLPRELHSMPGTAGRRDRPPPGRRVLGRWLARGAITAAERQAGRYVLARGQRLVALDRGSG